MDFVLGGFSNELTYTAWDDLHDEDCLVLPADLA
jgi:hypothetical protein